VDALDVLPHGFARTESGVEFELMQLAFTPEEVDLAGQLSRHPETAAEIAKRQVRLESKGMAAPGLTPETEGEQKYRLGSFLVGWYEAGMRIHGKDYAALFERYVTEGGGERIFSPRPSVLGVVPVRGSLKPELMATIEPHLVIDAHFERHDRFLLIECVCKREANLLDESPHCQFPMNRCGFVGLPPETPLRETALGREEASNLLDELNHVGGVQLAFYGFTMSADTPQIVGTCNCCDCCCAILRPFAHLGLKEAPQRSNYRAVIDPEICISCGVCQPRCPVDAIADDENFKSKVDRGKCIGCGVCVIECASDAIEMDPVSEEEWFHVPSSMEKWEEQRLEYLAANK
jgi:electron transport complex protein RnfB